MSARTTRAVTDIMRAIVREYRGSFARARLHPSVEMRRYYGRRTYMLSYYGLTRAGHLMRYDATRRILWIRPADRATRTDDVIDRIARTTAAETLLVDALLDLVDAGEITLEPFSETRDSLTAWRAARRG